MRSTAHVKLAFTIAEATESTGIGRTKLFALIREGRLETRKAGARTLIPAPALRALMESLPRPQRQAT
jgi:excisionase family DNA binding protein